MGDDGDIEQSASSSCITIAKSVHEKVPGCIADNRRLADNRWRIINLVEMVEISSGNVDAVVVVVDEVLVMIIFIYVVTIFLL